MSVLSRHNPRLIRVEATRLCGLLGALALLCATLWGQPASADEPPVRLSLVESHLFLGSPSSFDGPPTSFDEPPSSFGSPSRRASWFQRTAWGLAGTGASLLSGALYYRDRSDAFQRDYDALPERANADRYREVQRQIDDARYIMLALYAAGGTVITQSIILLTDDSDNPTHTRAEIAPTWRNGGPAAYLKISF